MHRILTLLAMVAVAALLMSGCSSSSNNPTDPGNNNEDLTPPAAPLNLTVHVKNDQVTVAWVENSEVDLSGYNIYRSLNGSDYEMLDTSSNARFVDTVPGMDFYHFAYRASAYDDSGNESAYSVPATIFVDNSEPVIAETDFPEW